MKDPGSYKKPAAIALPAFFFALMALIWIRAFLATIFPETHWANDPITITFIMLEIPCGIGICGSTAFLAAALDSDK